jgi:hypothetical protein
MLVMVVIAFGPFYGCAENSMISRSARQPMVENLHQQRMLALSYPPIIAIMPPEDLSGALRAAENADSSVLSKRESARWVNVDALPFLTATDSGKRFLETTVPRALARGMPPENCPVSAFASGAPRTSRAEVARRALQSCLAKLGPEQADCGCRIVALDDLVTIPREETAYATGTSARMRSTALGINLLLVAEEASDGGTLLRDLRGPVARLVHGENDSVTLSFLSNERHFDGFRIPVGFRRGRIAERITRRSGRGMAGLAAGRLTAAPVARLAGPDLGLSEQRQQHITAQFERVVAP